MAYEVYDLDKDEAGTAQFSGLRMEADAFLELPDDGYKYELLDGVVVMSPRPSPAHQSAGGEVYLQLAKYLADHPVGRVFYEVDVHLGAGPSGGDIVYAPDLIFVAADRVRSMQERIVGAPDLVMEVISRGSRRMDTTTKRADYERFGVKEYWIVDPQREAMTFLRLEQGKFVEVAATSGGLSSVAVPGFVLDVERVFKTFTSW